MSFVLKKADKLNISLSLSGAIIWQQMLAYPSLHVNMPT